MRSKVASPGASPHKLLGGTTVWSGPALERQNSVDATRTVVVFRITESCIVSSVGRTVLAAFILDPTIIELAVAYDPEL